MNKETGGPAFPTSNWQKMSPLSSGYHEGMTLRDYFAAKAMQGFIEGIDNTGGVVAIRDDCVAERAYEVADAMLKAREQ